MKELQMGTCISSDPCVELTIRYSDSSHIAPIHVLVYVSIRISLEKIYI